MNYNKLILSTTTLSLSLIGNVGAVDIENNRNEYIKLASIFPLLESDVQVYVSASDYLSDDMIIKKCIANNYELDKICPPEGSPNLGEVDHCDENPDSVGYNYIKCTCYYNVADICAEDGYTRTSCTDGWEFVGECPINNDYLKCQATPCEGYDYLSCPSGYTVESSCKSGDDTKYMCNITPSQQCVEDGYSASVTSCSGAYKLEDCSYDSSYRKCIAVNQDIECPLLGYTMFLDCSTYQNKIYCPYSSFYNKCVDMTIGEKCKKDGYSSFVTSCSDRYKLAVCPFSDTYKRCDKINPDIECPKLGYTMLLSCQSFEEEIYCPYSNFYNICVPK